MWCDHDRTLDASHVGRPSCWWTWYKSHQRLPGPSRPRRWWPPPFPSASVNVSLFIIQQQVEKMQSKWKETVCVCLMWLIPFHFQVGRGSSRGSINRCTTWWREGLNVISPMSSKKKKKGKVIATTKTSSFHCKGAINCVSLSLQ